MNSPCFICKGACCETIAIAFKSIPKDNILWLNLHEGVMANRDRVRFDCKCMELSDEGKCMMHDRRPQICRKLKIGSQACLNAIKERRIVAEPIYKAIKEFNAFNKS